MGEEISASKYMVTASWEDAPHLDEKTKAELLAATPPYLRDPRSKGILAERRRPVLVGGNEDPVGRKATAVDVVDAMAGRPDGTAVVGVDRGRGADVVAGKAAALDREENLAVRPERLG
jgi:hypothetical protein